MTDTTFNDYLKLLEEAKQTPEVKNAASLCKACIGYGKDRHLDMSLCYGGPTFRDVFQRALDNSKRG